MLASLSAKEGDSIQLGDKTFVIDGVLERELDRGAGFMNFAPRVMMSLSDLSSTGLIGLGSRVTYCLLLAGSDQQISAYGAWANQYIEKESLKGVRIEMLENAQPMMRRSISVFDRIVDGHGGYCCNCFVCASLHAQAGGCLRSFRESRF